MGVSSNTHFTMKLLVVLAVVGCALADSEADAYYGYGLGYSNLGYSNLGYSNLEYAGHLGYAGYGGYHGPLRTDTLPATVGGGLVPTASGGLVPADEPAVAHARAAHLSTKAAAYGYGLTGLGYAHIGYSNLGYANLGYSNLGYAGYHGYTGPLADAYPAGTSPAGLVRTASGGIVPAPTTTGASVLNNGAYWW